MIWKKRRTVPHVATIRRSVERLFLHAQRGQDSATDRCRAAPESNPSLENRGGTGYATSTVPMITHNCRERLTAADFEFVVQTLAADRRDTASLAELLTDADARDSILDHDALFSAVLESGAQLSISPQCYFYIVLRHVLKQRGITSRETCDYLAALLEKFSRTERMRAPGGAGEGPQQYISDLLLALQTASHSQQFFLRAHLGNYSLFITGVFHDRVEHRSRRGGPDVEFYEGVGAASYHAAAGHTVARAHALAPIYEELSERFHDIRVALNDTAEHHLHLDQPSAILLP